MENIEAMLCAYIEGDLDAAGRAQIEKHLQENPRHQKLIQELMTTRDLVRDLPRVKAPVDVGESVRGRVERSILLDDSPQATHAQGRGNWWPQVFAVAAVLLLCASLCLILFKALAPTLKPAVFTVNAAPKPSVESVSEAMTPLLAPTSRPTEVVVLPAVSARPSIAEATPVPSQQSALPVPKQAVEAVPLDNAETIRRWLRNSGYDVGTMAGAAPAPVLMVVNSSDPLATNVQVQQFLRDSSGISWKMMPSARPAPAATTLPSADVSQQSAASGMPTTQPSSDVYVASGLTSNLADALRQSLAGNKGTSIQVSVESSGTLATTQPAPSVAVEQSEVSIIAAPPVATQPSEVANKGDSLAVPSTLPSDARGPGVRAAFANGATARVLPDISGNRDIQPVDAVIVIQSAPALIGSPNLAPSTRPAAAAPSTQP